MARLLHVEDNESDQLLVRHALEQQHTVVSVSTLADAIALVQDSTQQFDGILLDLKLTDSSGILTLRRLGEESGAIPVMVLTGFAPEPTEAEPVVRFVDKEVLMRPQELQQQVERLLNQDARDVGRHAGTA